VLTEQESKLNQVIAAKLPGATLSPGDTGDKVTQLQSGLNKLGYFSGETTGSYDAETVTALAKFQVAAEILDSETSYGAGWFGAKTQAVFNAKLRDNLLALPALPTQPDFSRKTVIAFTPQFDMNLVPGDSGESVKNLQATLKELGHFTGEVTGSYGAETTAAVLAFQLDAKIVNSQNDPGAGYLGPKTRTALNAAVSREKVALTKTVPAS
jgi:peptidoglycan hydrolase-like protein with peptidoglycan-binding domain